MFGKLLFIIGLVAAGLLLVMLNFTIPSSIGAPGIFAVFLFGYIATLSAVTFGLWGIARVLGRISSEARTGRVGEPLSLRRSYYYATVIALAPVIIVSLQSVGGVGPYELGLIGLFVVLGCIYVARRLRFRLRFIMALVML